VKVPEPVHSGTFVAVVGPSGAGKDSLIDYARQRASITVLFPRRRITRPPGDPSEEHVAMSERQYTDAAAQGDFALTWSAHGVRYALPNTLDAHLRCGGIVVANISRTVLPAAHRRYPRVVTVFIDVSREILATRLRTRGRESPDEISARLIRTVPQCRTGSDVVVIDNSGPLERAGERIVSLLAGLQNS
jgi:ribose 1,5-bisphosphokinase